MSTPDREMAKIENAHITATTLGFEDHGLLTFWLHLAYGGSGQGFGGYSLTTEHVRGILRVLGISKWEDIAGRYVRCLHTNSKAYAIGHIVEDRWYDLETGYRDDEADDDEETE